MSFTLKISSGGEILRPLLHAPSADTHKYERGHAMIISGPELHTGAARLSAQAALSIGAGLVSILGDKRALAEHAANVTAIMLKPADDQFSVIDERVRSLAIGPAAGIGQKTRDKVMALLARQLPIVLDADALTSFSDDPQMLFSVLHDNAILTPHEGEFSRLFPDIMLNDRHNAALMAAQKSGAVVLLKGPQSIISAPNGRSAINRHSSSWLATAGSGDVLTGIICGLLAQGTDAFDAACMAAWLHGDIGVCHGPGLSAEIMIHQIPNVLQKCLTEQ